MCYDIKKSRILRYDFSKRKTGIEPAGTGLGSQRSTIERLPHYCSIIANRKMTVKVRGCFLCKNTKLVDFRADNSCVTNARAYAII